MPAQQFLLTPNSEGVVSLGELYGKGQQYLGTCRADGTIILTPVVKTPFVGEQSTGTSGPSST